MGWDGMGLQWRWNGVGCEGMGWYGMGWNKNEMGRDTMRWEGRVERVGMGLDGIGYERMGCNGIGWDVVGCYRI